MRRALLAAALALAAFAAPAQAAEFGISNPEVTFGDAFGEPQMQAGGHPEEFYTAFDLNTEPAPEGGVLPAEEVRDVRIAFPAGLVGTPTPVPRCSDADFLRVESGLSHCPISTVIGRAEIAVGFGPVGSPGAAFEDPQPVFNLNPAPGVASKIGFIVKNVPVTVETGVNPDPPYNLITEATNIPDFVQFYGSRVTLWGVPADPIHDEERGGSVNLPLVPFLTMPSACEGPLHTVFEADSWQHPGEWTRTETETNDGGEPPLPIGTTKCEWQRFNPTIDARPTSEAASSPTGLDFTMAVKDEGLTSATGTAQSRIRKAVVTLPEGMSANPSLAEGLEVCTEAQLDAETAFSDPGAGCPNASTIGAVEVESPLVDEKLEGSLFAAKPYENYAEDSLLALYLVVKNAKLGVIFKQPLKVEPDPVTGQLTTVAEEIPQWPFSHFRLHFREGARSPLTTPQACGSYDAVATLYPYSGNPPITTSSTFEIVSGPDNGPCPSGGLPPFKPGLNAGTINNRAGSFSPFNVRLHRTDSEQEITHFSIKLPPGISGKLAGIPYCPDAAIAAAKARTGPHGGQEELDSPSCPAASEIGRTLAGAGVGPGLTYAPGKVYLAGPYHGSKLSMVAITAGVVGPFDIGTVVVREGFKIDPETAEVFIDSTGSDPIPHIVRGIPVHLRDIRAYVDRPNFVLNPTDCTETSTASTVLGSGLDFVSEADDNPVTVTTRFQAADCAALRFKPQLGLKLKGGTKRGAHPAFHAHLEMSGIGEAGIARAQVTLPRSEFIENAHFRTICTRVQFKAGGGNGEQCPPGSIYGTARAITPILDEPLTGPVFLRSSEHQLPDLVVALSNSQVDFNLVGRVDSVKGGGLRNTFEAAPDAPVSSFDLWMAGGKKGLFVNSTDLCRRTYRARAVFHGQNGKRYAYRPKMRAVKCAKQRKRKRARHARAARISLARAAG